MALYICKKPYTVPAEGKINPAEDTEHWGLFLPPGPRGERGASLWTAAKFALGASTNDVATLTRSELSPAGEAPRVGDIVCGMTSAAGTALALGTIDLIDEAGQYLVTTRSVQNLKGVKGDKGDIGPGIIPVTGVRQNSDTSYDTTDTFPPEVVAGSILLVTSSSGRESLIGTILSVTSRYNDTNIAANQVGNIRGPKGETGSSPVIERGDVEFTIEESNTIVAPFPKDKIVCIDVGVETSDGAAYVNVRVRKANSTYMNIPANLGTNYLGRAHIEFAELTLMGYSTNAAVITFYRNGTTTPVTIHSIRTNNSWYEV